MRANFLSYGIIAVLGAAVLGLLGWQHRQTNGLHREVARLRSVTQERARLQAENRQLVAAQVTETELADVIARRMEAEELRTQLATMQRRVAAAKQAAVAAAAAAATKAEIPSLDGNSVAAHLWQNAGQATPAATFQTTLWASAAGDIDALTDLLAFDVEARREATATFDRLPVSLQNELGTPERLIALLTAMDVPLGHASIVGQFPNPTDTKVTAQLTDAGGKSKTAVFSLRADGDRWRLVVPVQVVQQYAGWLHAPSH